MRADVTTQEGVETLFSNTEVELGNVDIIVPNATCEQPVMSIVARVRPMGKGDWKAIPATPNSSPPCAAAATWFTAKVARETGAA